MLRVLISSLAVAALGAADALAQWITFAQESWRLAGDPATLPNCPEEKDYAWGDVNRDGWTDLVAVRKRPFTFVGPRTNLLLLNEGGILTDRTAEYVTNVLDVPGDQGFLTPTGDWDVKLVDVNHDGWLDIVTAVALGNGLPKHLSHPRIYINLGEDANGQWLGFQFQNFRVPTLSPGVPRFAEVAAGDLNMDGFVDLFFSDFDASGALNDAPPDQDTNSRLLRNDGTGVFTDVTPGSFSNSFYVTGYGAAAAIADLNGNGRNDLVMVDTLTPAQKIKAAYQSRVPGFFDLFQDPLHMNQPYHLAVGDLNSDGRVDIVVQFVNVDDYLINDGNHPDGTVNWLGTSSRSRRTRSAPTWSSPTWIATACPT